MRFWIGVLLFFLAWFLVRDQIRRAGTRQRDRWRRASFPPEWEDILHRNVSLYRHLPSDLKEQLHGDIQVFLAEKRFEGAGGLEMTEEIRVTVAGEAGITPVLFPSWSIPGRSSGGMTRPSEGPPSRARLSWRGNRGMRGPSSFPGIT